MRWLAPGLLLLVPLAALALFQGTIAAGLVPLAVFGPVYALTRALSPHGDPRVRAGQIALAATAGVGLAFLPAAGMLPHVSTPAWAGLGTSLVAVGAGALAGFAAAPDAPAGEGRRERWAFVDAMQDHHARGLALLAGVAVAAGTLLGLLREAPIARFGASPRTLPEAVLGGYVVDGALVVPDPAASVAVAIPLSIAPLALGFLTSPRRAGPLAIGGLAVPMLAPLVLWLDVPVRADTGAWVPIGVLEQPGLAVARALAPAAAGLLVGAAIVYAARNADPDERATRALWALGAALATLALGNLAGALLAAAGVLTAGLVVALAADRAPFGLAVLVGAGVGGLPHRWLAPSDALAVGVLVGAAAGAAAATYAASRSIAIPREKLNSPWTLAYVLAAFLGVGLAWAFAEGQLAGSPFPAPHARALASGLDVLAEGRGVLLAVWGLLAGGLLQFLLGSTAWVAVGALAGPGVGLLVLAGSLLRALWERGLLDRAREGYVMRGQLGYELLRAHGVVVGVLAGEGLAMAVAGAVG